mgnify:CR=1 FL=1
MHSTDPTPSAVGGKGMPLHVKVMVGFMLGTVLGALGQQEYFRQYFEAEDCALENLTVYRNPLSSYSGDRFAYNMFSQPAE